MNDVNKALKITGLVGIAFALIGYVGVFVGGDFGTFTGGAMPGILAGISLLILLVISKRSSSR